MHGNGIEKKKKKSLHCVDVSYPSADADTPPNRRRRPGFQGPRYPLLERVAQDTSQAAHKGESWSRIAHLVNETELHRTASLAVVIVTTIGAEHADKLGEFACLL